MTCLRIPGLFLLALALALPAIANDDDRWVSLGELHVRDRTERDTLKVGVAKGRFEAVRLRVQRRAVQFRDMKVHFENGDVQDVPLRSRIRAGKRSRVIDLDGGKRAIEKIVFRYDAQTPRRGQGARIEVYGRR